MSIPTTAQCLSPWATREKVKSPTLLQELCLEVSPTISSLYHPTSCTSSFLAQEVPVISSPGTPVWPVPWSTQPEPNAYPCGYWVHRVAAPCCFFRLSQTWPHGLRPGPPDARRDVPLMCLAVGRCPGSPCPGEVAEVPVPLSIRGF